MRLSHPFSEQTRLLFLYCYKCGECGQNGSQTGGLELHHIYGRVSSSAYNAIVLCKWCHNRVCHNLDEHVRYSQRTIGYLGNHAYQRTEEDNEFLVGTVLPDIKRKNEIDALRGHTEQKEQ